MAQIIHFPKRTSLEDYASIDSLEKRRLAKLFGMRSIVLPKGQPRPGELWKSVKVGTQGPRMYLVLETSIHKDGEITISWIARGEHGAGLLKSFLEKRIRVGWLGE